MIASVQALLENDEGRRLWPYTDTHGHLTWGIGHLLGDNDADDGVSDDVATLLNQAVDLQFQHDIASAMAAMGFFPEFASLDPVRQAVLIDMAFNLGARGVSAFTTFLSCVSSGQWAAAAADLRGTLVYSQLPGRYERLATMIQTGEWPA
jgi:lysozyme